MLEVARAWCLCKDGGSLTIAVMYGADEIAFNAHRVYGDVRWPYLTTNWNQHYLGTGWQRVHVFTKIKRCISAEFSGSLGIKLVEAEGGIFAETVVPGGAAHKQGVRSGMQIREVDGMDEPPTTVKKLVAAFRVLDRPFAVEFCSPEAAG